MGVKMIKNVLSYLENYDSEVSGAIKKEVGMALTPYTEPAWFMVSK